MKTFRAFDPSTDKMYYPPNSHIYMNIDGTCINFQNGEILEVMLWTGLEDDSENQTLIYFGDICKGSGGSNDFYFEIGFEHGSFIAKMPWIKSGKFFPELKHYVGMDFVETVVVGNIKQNKIEDFT